MPKHNLHGDRYSQRSATVSIRSYTGTWHADSVRKPDTRVYPVLNAYAMPGMPTAPPASRPGPFQQNPMVHTSGHAAAVPRANVNTGIIIFGPRRFGSRDVKKRSRKATGSHGSKGTKKKTQKSRSPSSSSSSGSSQSES